MLISSTQLLKRIALRISSSQLGIPLSGLSSVVIAYIDYLTPPEIPIDSFYVIPIWLATRLFGLLGGGIVVITSLSLYYISNFMFSFGEGIGAVWPSMLLHGLIFILFSLVSYFFLLNQQRLKQVHTDLQIRLIELNQLLEESKQLHQQNLQLVVIEERNRLAREMHDVLAQGLTAILLQVDAACLNLENPEILNAQLVQIRQTAHYNLQEARRSVSNLRPLPLEGLSLPQALEQKAREFRVEHKLETSFSASENFQTLPPVVETALLRIMQEALNNVAHHALAEAVQVTLDYDEDEVCLTISDNGQGFMVGESCIESDLANHNPSSSLKPTFGLSTMQERAQLVGGWVAIHSTPGQGCRVRAIIPYPRPDQLTQARQSHSASITRLSA